MRVRDWLPLLAGPLIGGALFAAAIWAVLAPNYWHDTVVLRVCHHGVFILRKPDGTIWARRNGFMFYRVEADNVDKVCGA